MIIHVVCHSLQPVGSGAVFHASHIGDVLEPRVLGGSVPVFHALGDGDDGAGLHLHSLLAPLLIPATAGDADKHLHGFVMNVPVVAATGFKRYIYHAPLSASIGAR